MKICTEENKKPKVAKDEIFVLRRREVIELRWVMFGPNKQLEYRVLNPSVDASGGLCPGSEWSNWKVVPTVDGEEAAVEDLIASGGIEGATTMSDYIDIVFDGPPGPTPGRFVEVENAKGESINFGGWVQREDGYWVLRINAADEIASLRKRLERAREGFHRIQVNAASSKAPEVFGTLASGYLRELESEGCGDE